MRKRLPLAIALLTAYVILGAAWVLSPGANPSVGPVSSAACERIAAEAMTERQVEVLLGGPAFCSSLRHGGGRVCLFGGAEEGGIAEVAFGPDGHAEAAAYRPSPYATDTLPERDFHEDAD